MESIPIAICASSCCPSFHGGEFARGPCRRILCGAPWNSVAVDAGLGVILHFGCEIFPRAPEKVLALRESTLASDPQLVAALVRAVVAAAEFCDDAENRDAVGSLLSREDRVAVDARLIRETLAGRLTIDARGRRGAPRNISSPDGTPAGRAHIKLLALRANASVGTNAILSGPFIRGSGRHAR